MSSPESTNRPKVIATFLSPGSEREERRILRILRAETVGGVLLVLSALVALIWANSPWSDSYFALRDFEIGYAPWNLKLSLGTWAADGLLAIFFFLVGLELKREFVAGDLRKFSTAIVPMAAAAGGVLVPALIYTLVVRNYPNLHHGWAIPTATDIAFAVSVLALIGSALPSAVRIFLLTLAVVDDLIAIFIIAIFYSTDINYVALLISFAVIALYGAIAQYRRLHFALKPATAWYILLPLGVVAWAFMHMSGIHATIAGVLLGFTIPVKPPRGLPAHGNTGLAGQFEHRFRPISAGVAVPLFAFFSAGVAVGSFDGFIHTLASPAALGVMAGLVFGKPIGISFTTWLITRIGPIRLDPSVKWLDLFGMSVLAGIGFTVSLLVSELSFEAGHAAHAETKVAILTASVIAALLSSLILVPRNRLYRRGALPKEVG
ncbi:Na+/H+ antiporter NhaA [Actinomyces sp. F1_1611]